MSRSIFPPLISTTKPLLTPMSRRAFGQLAAFARIVACSSVPRRLKAKVIGLASTNATLAASRSP